ncbi:Uncharacterized protein M6B38_211680 [Iris pallida]|uniref:Uncharacterized protein n=1 Tax=Iris pallida TaxID=29817 RepID=A0AAX6E350_IRIPA|nr:Uncharacterized protein M6B38_211680 [Iris pallida]
MDPGGASTEGGEKSPQSPPPPQQQPQPQPQQRKALSCTKCFDALWFCYSPFHQMQQYYRQGEFDTCFGKWDALFDCLSLKTKRSSEVQEILDAREKAKQHIWTYRTVEEASANWWRMYNRFHKPPSQSDT